MTELERNSRGRPLIEFDWDLLNKTLARCGRMPDCVYFLGVSASTIERRIRDEYGMTFNEYRDLHMTGTRMKIMDAQLKVGIEMLEPSMLIHLGKQYNGQSDKHQNLNVSASVEDYLRSIHGSEGEYGQD